MTAETWDESSLCAIVDSLEETNTTPTPEDRLSCRIRGRHMGDRKWEIPQDSYRRLQHGDARVCCSTANGGFFRPRLSSIFSVCLVEFAFIRMQKSGRRRRRSRWKGFRLNRHFSSRHNGSGTQGMHGDLDGLILLRLSCWKRRCCCGACECPTPRF